MKLTGLEVFDSTIQRTNVWLKDLMQELNWSDRRKTYLALRCVLHALRDHMSAQNAAFLGEQLPMLIRGFYFENWDPAEKPIPWRSRDDFFSALSAYLAQQGERTSNAELVTQAVFRLLEHKATDGEIADVHDILPQGLIDLWPHSLRAA